MKPSTNILTPAIIVCIIVIGLSIQAVRYVKQVSLLRAAHIALTEKYEKLLQDGPSDAEFNEWRSDLEQRVATETKRVDKALAK